jgi:hypothetical protein
VASAQWVEVRRRASLTGVVAEAETGKPVEGAAVEILGGPAAFEKLRARAPGRAATTSLPDGTFHYLDLPPGQYTIGAAAGGRFGTAKAKGRVRRPGGDPSPPPHVELALSGTRIAGKVTAADGDPVPLATVRVRGSGERALTAADGTFVLRGLELGDRRIDVAARGFEPAAEDVALRRAGAVRRANIALTRSGN